MSWNHRIAKDKNGGFYICEAYYDDEDPTKIVRQSDPIELTLPNYMVEREGTMVLQQFHQMLWQIREDISRNPEPIKGESEVLLMAPIHEVA
mgnify:CR=1 FL=1